MKGVTPRMENFEAWLLKIREARRLALISHTSPDGDTVGSTLALRLALLSLGKDVDAICDGEPPKNMRYLSGIDAYITPDQAKGPYDAALAIDVSDPKLMGKAIEVYNAAPVHLVIDHHATNPGYGDVNFIRRGESSCCVLAYEAIIALGVTMNKEIGTCLMTGISTDSGHFQYNSTSPASLYAAAKLVECGVDISYITRVLYRTQPMERVKLTRIAYNRMRFELGGQVGVIYLTREDFEETGCTFGQADGLVNKALEVEGVRFAVMASERAEGIKMSMRSVEPDTINDVAVRFGGGGHAQAAGCTIEGKTIDEALAMVLGALAEKLGEGA